MDARQKLFKAGARLKPTLSERVKNDKNRRQMARSDKFASSRRIQLDVSPQTPVPHAKISKISDRNEKLRAYRIQKNTQKFKEVQEQRSPFIAAVPVGRWIEKKERAPVHRIDLTDTPVKAMMNERALKKSTIKTLIKKENPMIFTAQLSRPTGLKAKKKILTEVNSIPMASEIEMNEEPLPQMDIDLNSTFEISPEDEVKAKVGNKGLRRSKSIPEITRNAAKHNIRRVLTPPAKKVTVKEPVMKSKAIIKAVEKATVAQIKKPVAARIVKPVIVPAKNSSTGAVKKPRIVQKVAPEKKGLAPKPVSVQPLEAPLAETKEAPVEPAVYKKVNNARPVSRKEESNRSNTYKLYKSMMDNHATFLTSQLKKIEDESVTYIELLDEEQKIVVQQTIQQGKVLTAEKFKRFEFSLLEHENGLSLPDALQRVTEDDVENYWDLLFDEIKKLKANFAVIEKMKGLMMSVVASQKKRRTRRTYIPEDGTPKRSRRIADNADTPKHNASCYGCVTMSASKTNTPKSIKRRTTRLQRSETRRSSKKSTLACNLARTIAVDKEEEDEIAELL